MTHDEDDDALDGIDLHMWRVPPPGVIDRPSLLLRALSPATAPAKRPRLVWILAAIVLLNAALVTLVVIVLVRSPAAHTTVTMQPAGGGSVDTQVRDLLQRLEREQRELERKLTELQELRALVLELSEKLRRYEQQDGRRDRTVPKPADRQAPDPIDPKDNVTPSSVGRCDEVSCVLSNYEGPCCAKFRRPHVPITTVTPASDPQLETLTRTSISRGIAAVKGRVAACADQSTAKGTVKVRVKVGTDGLVTSVVVDRTPDAALGACVAAVVQRAVFARTQQGGSFSYPFVF